MPVLPNAFEEFNSVDEVMPSADQAVASTTPTDAAAEPIDDHRFELDAKAFMIETMERPFFMMRETTD